jgi:hypothetical protein
VNKKNHRYFALISTLFITILACSVPGVGNVDINPTSVHETVVAQLTIESALTQVAGGSAGDIPEATATPEPDNTQTPNDTAAPEMSPTPENTASSTPSPTPAATNTPDAPTFGVTTDTNCRTGPGLIYDAKTPMLVGETLKALGRDSGTNFYYTDRGCWVWTNYAFAVTGSLNNLPVFTPPPTPTLSPQVWDGKWFVITETTVGELNWNQTGLDVAGTMTFIVEDDGGNEIIIIYEIYGDVDPSGEFVSGQFNLVDSESYLDFTFYIGTDRRTFTGSVIVVGDNVPLCGARTEGTLPSCLP